MRGVLAGVLVAAVLGVVGLANSASAHEGTHCSGRVVVPTPAWDQDCDTVPDDWDNCEPRWENDFAMRNPDQVNTDRDFEAETGGEYEMPPGDEFGDRCDADDDADGVADGGDNCRTVRNPDQLDTNRDGVGEACTYDHDDDDVIDPQDNCPPRSASDRSTYNPDQRDTDGDGLGDVCDRDDDDDYVPDASDNCPRDFNAGQEDHDGDGIGAACDPGDVPPGTPLPSTPPPSTDPPAAVPPDLVAPTLALSLPRALRLRELGRSIAVEVGCSELCTVRAALVVKRTRVAEGTAGLGGRGTTYVFMRRLKRLAPAKATLRLTATDAAGNVRRASRRVLLRR